jgi:integrase
MPANYLMSWDSKSRRWWIQYKRKRYLISCRQLGSVQTKEGSYQAANAWWLTKKKELDRLAPPARDDLYPPYHPHEDEIVYAQRKREWLQANEQHEEAVILSKHLDVLKSSGPEDTPGFDPTEAQAVADNLRLAKLAGIEVPPDLDPIIARMIFGNLGRWEERLRRNPETPRMPADRSVVGLVARWLKTQEAKVGTGQLSPGRHNNVRYCLDHFSRFLGAGSGVEVIDGKRWGEFYGHCLEMVKKRDQAPSEKDGWSRDYAAAVFKVARRFVRWLWGEALIDLPRNLDSRDFTFGTGAKIIKPMGLDDFRTLARTASAKVELYLLLMANCGFRSKDIGDLLDSEVDWDHGRIKRKRSKTRKHKDVPVVDYPLWHRTFALLKRFRSGSELVLMTTTGRPLVEEWLDAKEDKLKSKDAVTMCYQRLQKKTGVKSPLGAIRKASATLLESSNDHARFRDVFLGHSPKDLGEKHYADLAQARFDEAITWLGTFYVAKEA